jgi:hypothetical protein
MEDEHMKTSPSAPSGIQLQADERGLPIALTLDQRALSSPPAELARKILLLSQLAARRAQVARRRDLAAQGYSAATIDGLNLATAHELTCTEAHLCGDDIDGLPDSWLAPR